MMPLSSWNGQQQNTPEKASSQPKARTARKLVLPTFELTEVAPAEDAKTTMVRLLSRKHPEGITYYTRPKFSVETHERRDGRPCWTKHQFNLLPVVLDQNGVPWAEAKQLRHAKVGQAVRQFMTERIIPYTFLRRDGCAAEQREQGRTKLVGGVAMNRLHIHHTLVLVLLLVGAMTLMMVASLYETCQAPTTDATHVTADAIPNAGKPDKVPPHCLVYGKYCLGESLHGR